MRIIATEKKNKQIHSPWYREDDAAAYCGISRSEFHERAKDLPHAGKHRLRIYHQSTLDAWLNDTLGIPFDPEEQPVKKPVRIARIPHVSGYTNPNTGKFRPCAQQ